MGQVAQDYTDTMGRLGYSLAKMEPDNVRKAWGAVANMLERSTDRGVGEYTMDDLMSMCINGHAQLWVAWDDNKVHGVLVTQIVHYPKMDVLFILQCACDVSRETLDTAMLEVERWAKEQGCDKSLFYGRKGWAKKPPIGYNEKYIAMSKDLRG